MQTQIKLIERGKPIPAMSAYGIRLPSAVPTTVECPIHGVQTYEAREIRAPYCPKCEAIARKEREAKAQIHADSLALARALQAQLPDGGLNDLEGVFSFGSFAIDAGTQAGRDGQKKCLGVASAFAKRFLIRELERRNAKAEGKDYRRVNCLGLRFLGSVGTGKTHLALAIRDKLHALGFEDALYLPFQRLLDAIYSRDSNTTELMGLLGRTSCLILDELGAYDHSEADLKRLFQIIDSRYMNGRPTVVITNLEPKRLRDAVGERTYERLRETTVPLVFAWETHRKSAKVDLEAEGAGFTVF